MKLTKAQRTSLHNLYQRDTDGSPSYLHFRRRVFPLPFEADVAMIEWCNILIGIEPDGYTHS